MNKSYENINDEIKERINEYSSKFGAFIASADIQNKMFQSKYYPQYRKIFLRSEAMPDRIIEQIHEKYHITLGNLTSGNMIYSLWRILQVVNVFMDIAKIQYMKLNTSYNKNVLSEDFNLSQYDEYVDLCRLYLDIYKVFNKLFRTTIFVQEGAATYVSLHAKSRTDQDLSLIQRQTELREKLVKYEPYQMALKIESAWEIDRYAVQDTAKMVLDYAYPAVDLLALSEQELDELCMHYDSKTRWEQLLNTDKKQIELTINALEQHDVDKFFYYRDQLFTKIPYEELSYKFWLNMIFFSNKKVLSVLHNVGFGKVGPADLWRMYFSDELIRDSQKQMLAFFSIVDAENVLEEFNKKINENIVYDDIQINIAEMCEMAFIKSRATQCLYVTFFYDERNNNMRNYIMISGKKEHLLRIQQYARDNQISVMLGVDTGENDLNSFLSADIVLQIILIASSSSVLTTLCKEEIKKSRKDIKIKKEGEKFEIDLKNATNEDIDRLLALLNEKKDNEEKESNNVYPST